MWQTYGRKRTLRGILSVVALLIVNPTVPEGNAENTRVADLFPTSTQARAGTFDLTGVWRWSGVTMQVYQSGSDVTGVLVTKHFAHLFRGKFDSPSTVVGKYISRRNRVNGCETEMQVTITILSNNRFRLRWLGLDSRCDLKEGQQGTDTEYRRQL